MFKDFYYFFHLIRKAAEEHGAGAGGTRNISGNSMMHENLEKELASLHQKDGALVSRCVLVSSDTFLLVVKRTCPKGVSSENVHFLIY